jgi:hypothetical protein
MAQAHKGQRQPRRASNAPPEASGGRLRRVQALIDELSQGIEDGSLREIPDDALEILEITVSKITHANPGNAEGGHLLVNELTYEPEDADDVPKVSPSGHQSSSHSPSRLEHHINLRAGRSSVHRPRSTYFPPVPEVDEDEQRVRSTRSDEANLRKATLSVRDLLVAEDCRLWVGLTADDQHLGQLTPKSMSDFTNKLSRAHKKKTGEHLHYGAVIGTHGRGPHVHGLFSTNLDPDLIRELWPYGAVDEIVEIPEELIEEKVGYMADNIRQGRISHSRYFRSRGSRQEKLVIPVESVEEAREGLADMIAPNRPSIRTAQPFGDNPRVTFRFKPHRGEGDG